MVTSVLSHLEMEASIHFDAEQMAFVGVIETQSEPIYFSATNIDALHMQYSLAVARANQSNELFDQIAKNLISVPKVIQSGEAKIELVLNETNERIGMMIKMMLLMADGARIYVQEKQS